MILKSLVEMQDTTYKSFQCKLMPTVNPDTVIGVRTPQLRAFAKRIAGSDEAETFLQSLPHRYYEENNIHAVLIESQKDYDKCIGMLDSFLPYVDNWATCDMMTPKVFSRHREQLLLKIPQWLSSGHTYTIRFGIKMLMNFYLDECFDPAQLAMVGSIKSNEYYVNMMIAWYFATALAKQYTSALPYITEYRLPTWVHNKTIQKAVESYRISQEQKQVLKSCRIK